MTSSTTRAFMAKKQSISFAQVATNLLNVLQGYSKTIRLLLVMFLTLTVTTNAWGADYTLVTSNTNLNNGDKVIIATKNSKGKPNTGVTGQDGDKDAIVSTTESNWVQYIVGSASTSGWTLYDSGQDKYIAQPTGNHFKYSTTAGTCFVNNDGVLGCNSRYLQANGTNYRMYSGINNSYTPFYVWKVSASYTVTATSNNNNYGTVSVSGTTITASPKTGYTYANPAYTVTYGTAIVTQNGNTFTVSPSTNCTVRINFEAKPKYTVTLKDDDSELTQSTAGGSVDLPSREGCDGYTFAGWTNSWKAPQTSWTTTAPTIIPAGSYTPTANESLYPVYTKTEGGGTVYEKVTTLTEGVYVMVSEKTSGIYKYMPNTTSNSNPTLGSGITMNSGKTSLTSNITEAMLWDLTATGTANQYYLRPHGSTTIGLGCTTSTGANIRISTSYKDVKWTIKTNSDYGWQFKSNASTAMYLAVYNDDNWRNYTSPTTNQNGKFYLFKQTSSSITSYISVPDCATQTSRYLTPKHRGDSGGTWLVVTEW